MEKYTQEEIDIYRIRSGNPGPTLTISGAVHGNEKSGTKGIMRLISLIEEGRITLEQGSLTLIPIANPRAYRDNVRFVEYNLNRSMYRRAADQIIHYEDRLRNVLCPVLEETDYLLDIHSCTAPSDAFVIVGGDLKDSATIDFAKGLGASRMIWGWQDVVEQSNALGDPRHAYGMTEYAREHGARAITIECGNHEHPDGPAYAFRAACNAIRSLGIASIDPELLKDDVFGSDKISIRLKGAVFKTREGSLCDAWVNMQPLSKGTPIARFDDGEEFAMPEDGYIVMPNKNAAANAEWFYWGVNEMVPRYDR